MPSENDNKEKKSISLTLAIIIAVALLVIFSITITVIISHYNKKIDELTAFTNATDNSNTEDYFSNYAHNLTLE